MTPLLVLTLAAALASVASRNAPFYRKDYTYLEEYDAFYKFHWDNNGSNWSSTFLACDEEGAELFYPKTREEWTVVQKLMAALPFAPNVSDIFVGIHDKFGVGEFITINGYPTPTPISNLENSDEGRCVTMDISTGGLEANECFAEPGTLLPFVCKKVQDVSCPTIDPGYHYFKETRKCYKINNKPMTWRRSMETCFMEGGILVVVESDIEADIIRNKVVNYYNDGANIFHAGFKRLFPNEEYYTVKGHKLSETGYERWYDRQNYECGVITNTRNDNIYFNSVECDSKLPFICEINLTV